MNEPFISPFKVIDLVSQGAAVAAHVRGWSSEEILSWLRHQGQLQVLPEAFGKRAFSFRSLTGITAQFLLDDDQFIFIGDNTLFRPQ